MAISYEPPSPRHLRELKTRLKLSGQQMADLFGLASSQQWHKYCLETNPRPMSLAMLFLAGATYLGARATVAQVFDWCRDVGAKIDMQSAHAGDQQR